MLESRSFADQSERTRANQSVRQRKQNEFFFAVRMWIDGLSSLGWIISFCVFPYLVANGEKEKAANGWAGLLQKQLAYFMDIFYSRLNSQCVSYYIAAPFDLVMRCLSVGIESATPSCLNLFSATSDRFPGCVLDSFSYMEQRHSWSLK